MAGPTFPQKPTNAPVQPTQPGIHHCCVERNPRKPALSPILTLLVVACAAFTWRRGYDLFFFTWAKSAFTGGLLESSSSQEAARPQYRAGRRQLTAMAGMTAEVQRTSRGAPYPGYETRKRRVFRQAQNYRFPASHSLTDLKMGGRGRIKLISSERLSQIILRLIAFQLGVHRHHDRSAVTKQRPATPSFLLGRL
jgi:hypothetical protein